MEAIILYIIVELAKISSLSEFILHFHLGHGSCINSRCECDEGFTGGACDCTKDNSSCVRPGDEGSDAPLCSGQGDCVCGVCICNDYGVNFGQYCEECVVSLSPLMSVDNHNNSSQLFDVHTHTFTLSHTHTHTHTAMSYIVFQGIRMCQMQYSW